MALKNDRYTYRITWSKNDQEYVGLCAEFPSLSWLDQTPEDALHGIRKIVDETVNDIRDNRETPPSPLADRPYSGKFMVRVPPEVHKQLTIKAAEEGISLNRLNSSRLSATN
jgi:predicted HicB family RNase H-like nuclease